MNTEEKDYLEINRSRITEQFKNANNLDRLMQIWTEGYQEIQEVILDMLHLLDIDTAVGAQLDMIGEIVGQPRELVDINTTGYFGFDEDPAAKKFGSVSNQQGGIWYSIRDPLNGTVELSDGLYREFIRAKIISNNAGGTPEEIITTAQGLFSVQMVELVEVGDATLTLNIGRRPWNDENLTAFPGLDETAIADRLLPVPMGVKVQYIDAPSIPSPIDDIEDWDAASQQLWDTANITLPANIGDTTSLTRRTY